MKYVTSQKPNMFHYVTVVTHNRIQVFRSHQACRFLVDALANAREKYSFKLIGYVVMPDHVHMIVNPLEQNIKIILKQIKGASAHHIIKWLRAEGRSEEHTSALQA